MQDCSNCELRDYCIPDECTKEKKPPAVLQTVQRQSKYPTFIIAQRSQYHGYYY